MACQVQLSKSVEDILREYTQKNLSTDLFFETSDVRVKSTCTIKNLVEVSKQLGLRMYAEAEPEKINKWLKVLRVLNQTSANGVVSISKIDVPSNKTNTVMLKAPIGDNSDPPQWEYFVGRRLNELRKYCPNYVVTLGAFKCNSSTEFLNINKKVCSGSTFGGRKLEFIIQEKVRNPAAGLRSFLSNQDFLTNNLYDVLGQLLCSLYIGQTHMNFVHYDLHTDNVLLMKPDRRSCICYDFGDNKYFFRGEYIPVMIDFGRAHVKDIPESLKLLWRGKRFGSDPYLKPLDYNKYYDLVKILNFIQKDISGSINQQKFSAYKSTILRGFVLNYYSYTMIKPGVRLYDVLSAVDMIKNSNYLNNNYVSPDDSIYVWSLNSEGRKIPSLKELLEMRGDRIISERMDDVKKYYLNINYSKRDLDSLKNKIKTCTISGKNYTELSKFRNYIPNNIPNLKDNFQAQCAYLNSLRCNIEGENIDEDHMRNELINEVGMNSDTVNNMDKFELCSAYNNAMVCNLNGKNVTKNELIEEIKKVYKGLDKKDMPPETLTILKSFNKRKLCETLRLNLKCKINDVNMTQSDLEKYMREIITSDDVYNAMDKSYLNLCELVKNFHCKVNGKMITASDVLRISSILGINIKNSDEFKIFCNDILNTMACGINDSNRDMILSILSNYGINDLNFLPNCSPVVVNNVNQENPIVVPGSPRSPGEEIICTISDLNKNYTYNGLLDALMNTGDPYIDDELQNMINNNIKPKKEEMCKMLQSIYKEKILRLQNLIDYNNNLYTKLHQKTGGQLRTVKDRERYKILLWRNYQLLNSLKTYGVVQQSLLPNPPDLDNPPTLTYLVSADSRFR